MSAGFGHRCVETPEPALPIGPDRLRPVTKSDDRPVSLDVLDPISLLVPE